MADSRIKDAGGTVVSGDLSALLNTLYLAVDDTSFTDFKKILLKTILTEAIVTANTNNYQAMTPKAFYDSIMTEVYNGIGKISSDANVTAKSGNDLLTAAKQVVMQTQWFKDWFIGNGEVGHYEGDTYGNEQAVSFDVNIYYTSLFPSTKYLIGPNLARNYKSVYYNLNMYVPGVGTTVVKTDLIEYGGGDVEKPLETFWSIGVTAGGANLYLKHTGALNRGIVLSAHFNCTMI